MARHEQDREDLLREATALVRRAEIRLADYHDSIVVGFRRDGSASLFWGSELVFQFNKRNELRRGFWNGRLIKAEQGRLVELARVRTSAEVTLRRRELKESETESFLNLFLGKARLILRANAEHDLTLVGQIPPKVDVVGLAVDWLSLVSQGIPIADRASVR